MASFTLPSGLTVETKEPTYGDIVHATSVGMDKTEEFHYAKFAVIVPALTREQVAGLSPQDGAVLAAEVNRIFHGRPEAKEIPFASKSRQGSRAVSPVMTKL